MPESEISNEPEGVGGRTIEPSELDPYFPSDHSDQIEATYYIDRLHRSPDEQFVFLDLGCAEGGTAKRVHAHFPNAQWIGVDIEDSPEVRKRQRTDLDFRAFDGVHIPADDASVDVVYCRQVFEHVRHPEPLLADVARILRPGGRFVGSVSQLEPLHSYSYWTFTYYGFAVISIDAGLRPVEFRPGVDGLTLISRHVAKFHLGLDVRFLFAPWMLYLSPLNRLFDRISPNDHAARNRAKVTYAGHLCFVFEKPTPEMPPAAAVRKT
jgi:SAM-dependent methyltransferase